MQDILNIFSYVFLVSGTFFVVVGAIGTVRFPDFWARLHAASVTESGGVILILAGLCLQVVVTVKLIIIAFPFMLTTSTLPLQMPFWSLGYALTQS